MNRNWVARCERATPWIVALCAGVLFTAGAGADEPAAAPAAAPAAPAENEAAAPARLAGVVTGSDGHRPVPGATVVVGSAYVVTDASGAFAVDDQPAGAYKVRVLQTGYDDAVVDAQLVEGQTVTLDVRLQRTPIGQEIVVTGSKFPEKRVEAPSTIERVTEEDLKLSGGSTSYVNALSRVKGIDYADNGVADKRVSARGFNSLFSSRMVWMVDNRLAEQPGNGLPLGGLLPTPSLDIKSIEIVVGPASALYGPNAHTGVINVLTKTPWDDSGVTISMRGGTQQLTDISLRVAGTVAHRFGYKLNAQYLQANEFSPDPNTPYFYYGSPKVGPLIFEPTLVPSYEVQSAKLEGYLYLHLGRWYLKAGYGYSYNTSLAATSAGRNYLKGYQVHVATVQASHPNWFVQVSRTATDTGALGNAYPIDQVAAGVQQLTAMGVPITPDVTNMLEKKLAFVDESQLIDSEIQYRNEFWRRLRVTGGAQLRAYLPVSNGSYLDDGPGRPRIWALEVGGYAQGDWVVVRDRLKLVGALRVDKHSDYDVQVSPKLATVLTLARSHNLRVGYSRAFKSPTILENYLHLVNPSAGSFLGNKTGFVLKDAGGNTVSTIAPLKPEEVNQLEVGYKGVVANRLFIDLDAYYSFYDNFISPLTVRALGAVNGLFAYYPDGTPVGQGLPVQGVLATYSNFGKAQVAGADVGADMWIVRDKLMISASVSYIHLVSFSNDDPTQKALLLNVPEWKGKASVTTTNLGVDHSFLRLQGRVQSAYRFASGSHWDSSLYFADGKIPARFVADLSLGYNFPHGVTVSGNVFNLTNDHGLDILGGPATGITAYLDLTYRYEGLER
jgi:iron complex outermembrane receptor protein